MVITQNYGRTLQLWKTDEKIENVKLDWFTKDMIDNFSLKQESHMLKVCLPMKENSRNS